MSHSRSPGYKPGDHWVECPRCGLDYRASDMKKEWTGLWVCKKDWEPRHPQEFVRGRQDQSGVKQPNYPDRGSAEGATAEAEFATYTVVTQAMKDAL